MLAREWNMWPRAGLVSDSIHTRSFKSMCLSNETAAAASQPLVMCIIPKYKCGQHEQSTVQTRYLLFFAVASFFELRFHALTR